MEDIHFASASELARLISARSISSLEVTQAYLDRIEQFDASLRAFITVDAERALQTARMADSTPSNGPLHGVPIAVKDNIATQNLRTTGGSRVLADFVPDHDAPVVTSLRQAGAVILGKTNLHEFAYGGTSSNVEFGAVRNPWNLEHVPGGSSGGSAAAVAAGLCAAALGTDTAGSVRLPAAQCGVVGLKPTYGRVSINGVMPLAWSLDHVGPITRSVEDAALVFRALAGADIPQPRTGTLNGLRLGVPRRYFFDGLHEDVELAIEEALSVLADQGALLEDVNWPDVHLSNSATWTIIMAEAGAYHRQWFRTRSQDYSAETRENLQLAEFLPAADYVQAQRVRTVLQGQAEHLLSTIDALITPALAITAPRLGQTTGTVGGKVKEINPVFIRLADPFNLTGMPAISVPCGFGSEGLPIGLQIAAAPHAEAAVLRIAAAYQAATEWHLKRPTLPVALSRA